VTKNSWNLGVLESSNNLFNLFLKIPKTIFLNVINNFPMSNVLEWQQVCIMQLKGSFEK